LTTLPGKRHLYGGTRSLLGEYGLDQGLLASHEGFAGSLVDLAVMSLAMGGGTPATRGCREAPGASGLCLSSCLLLWVVGPLLPPSQRRSGFLVDGLVNVHPGCRCACFSRALVSSVTAAPKTGLERGLCSTSATPGLP